MEEENSTGRQEGAEVPELADAFLQDLDIHFHKETDRPDPIWPRQVSPS